MSRSLPRSSALQAGLAALLVIGVLLLLVVAGHNRQESTQDTGQDSSVVPARELEDSMTSIASDKLFETVTAAQRAAGTWFVISASEQDGQSMAPSVQEISLEGDQPAIRTSFDSGLGTIEALYVGKQFYIKGFTGKEKPWWKVSTDDTASRLIQSLTPYADPTEFLSSMTSPKKFEIIGVEEIEALQAKPGDDIEGESASKVRTVHYRMQIEALGEKAPGTDEGATGETPSAATPMQMDMWVDAQDRPVRVETVVSSQGQRLTTRLYYGLYGEPVTIEVPRSEEITTEPPAQLAKALKGSGADG